MKNKNREQEEFRRRQVQEIRSILEEPIQLFYRISEKEVNQLFLSNAETKKMDSWIKKLSGAKLKSLFDKKESYSNNRSSDWPNVGLGLEMRFFNHFFSRISHEVESIQGYVDRLSSELADWDDFIIKVFEEKGFSIKEIEAVLLKMDEEFKIDLSEAFKDESLSPIDFLTKKAEELFSSRKKKVGKELGYKDSNV